MPRFVLILLCCLAHAAPTWAGFDEGVAAFSRGDYEVKTMRQTGATRSIAFTSSANFGLGSQPSERQRHPEQPHLRVKPT